MSVPWSPSRILVRRSCPRQEFLRWRDPSPGHEPGPEKPAPAQRQTTRQMSGTIEHAGFEAAYLAARENTAPWTGKRMSAFFDAAQAAMTATWARLVEPLYASGEIDDPDEEPGEPLSALEAEVYHALNRLPMPNPAAVLGVEHPVEVTMPSGLIMRGRVDLILQIGLDAMHVRDWKRSRLAQLALSHELADDDALSFYRIATAQDWPHLRRASVELYSVTDNRGRSVHLPFARAERKLFEQDAIAVAAEDDTEHLPTPDGENCVRCPVRGRCPVWTSGGEPAP